MTYYPQQFRRLGQKVAISLFALWVSVLSPITVLAEETSPSPTPEAQVTEEASPTPTPTPTPTPSPTASPTTEETVCTGAGCTQGVDQGFDQGFDQGGTTMEELGATQNEEGEWVLPEGVENTTQGAQQGTTAGITAENSETGADSDNTATVDVDDSQTTTVNNTADDTTNADLTANTGGNSGSLNSGSTAVKTGDANIGVTQVKNDNTTVDGGNVGVKSSGHTGDHDGDLELDFANAVSLLTGEGGSRSIRAINDTTGSGSNNDIILGTRYEDILEVQNDGQIDNNLGLDAITGQNDASMNTGDGVIATGNANIAATLVNLLNTTVINGNLAIEVHDIFGDLLGDIRIPDLAQLAAVLGNQTVIDASNEETGSDSDNSIAVNLEDTESTTIKNDADIDTNITANAITGQNETTANTGGSAITTGDGSVQASNVSVANTTVEGGNWGLVVVNAVNRWLGFLVGDNGETRALTQDETIREIEARNSQTGSDSDNSIVVNDSTNTETNIDNDARITNNVVANAITGQNDASKNTGAGVVGTGDANILANAINIANTTVKNANLGIAVVNVFGNWMGDLLYKGASLLAGSGGGDSSAGLAASNSTTGANSDNTIDVNIDRSSETMIDNNADIDTVLNANIDTGSNTANKNTKQARIETGDSLLALHSRAVANVTGISGQDSLELTITGVNDTTGAESKNKINARVNDEKVVTVTNNANVSTVFTGGANTGNNEASKNTGGGSVTTGDIAADVAMENMLNRVLVATGGTGGGMVLGTELTNSTTGADSENTNDVEVTRAFLLDIFNDATVDNIIDLLLNTGGNDSNLNTGGGSLVSGDICVDGKLVNDVNSTSGLWAATKLWLKNAADVDNDTKIDATTGDNKLKMNTVGDDVDDHDGLCDRIAQKPEEPEKEKPDDKEKEDDKGNGGNGGDGDNGDGEGGVGGNGGEEELPVLARVAGAKVAQAAEKKAEQVKEVGEQLAVTGRSLLTRRQALWTLFIIGSGLLLAGAMKSDRQQRRMQQSAVAA